MVFGCAGSSIAPLATVVVECGLRLACGARDECVPSTFVVTRRASAIRTFCGAGDVAICAGD
jgi:hypothetical protein